MKIEVDKRYLVRKWVSGLIMELRCLEVANTAYNFDKLGWILKEKFQFDYAVLETLPN